MIEDWLRALGVSTPGSTLWLIRKTKRCRTLVGRNLHGVVLLSFPHDLEELLFQLVFFMGEGRVERIEFAQIFLRVPQSGQIRR